MGKRKKRPHQQKRPYPHREIATPACELVRNDSGKRKDSKGGAPEFEVRIRISKRPRVDHYSGDIEATSTTALIEALAVLIQKAADIIGAPTERVYAVVATLLFQEQETEEDAEPEQAEGK